MQAPSTAPAYAHINVNKQTATASRSRTIGLCILLSFLFFICNNTAVTAQSCTRQVRRYADFQGKYETGLFLLGSPDLIFGKVTNDAKAADNDPNTASTLGVSLAALNLATATQFLEFTTNGTNAGRELIAANTPVTIKFSVPSGLVGLLDGVEIGTFVDLQPVSQQIIGVLGTGPGNLAGYKPTSSTAIYSGNTLLNALNGSGIIELTLTPAQAYHGVYIKLSSLLSLALTTDVYHAYIMKDAGSTIDCNERVDVLYGVRGNSLINLASATGSVTNPLNTIDADPALATYSVMSTGVQVLSNVFQTVVFSTPSVAGDSVSVVVQNPGGGLLDLNLLTGFTIQPYLGSTAVGPALVNNPSFLSLRLFPGSADKYIITAAVAGAFDRVEILMGGVAGALASLRVYDVSRIVHPPLTELRINAVLGAGEVCASEATQVTLGVSNGETCATYTWYDAGGNLMTSGVAANGLSFAPGITAAGTYSYTLKATRNGCNNTAVQAPVSYTIHPSPVTPVVPPVIICTGQSAALTVTNPETGIAYYWYSTATEDVPPANAISSGTSYTTGTPPAFTTYYVAAYNPVTHCISDNRGQGNITITPHPGVPSLSIQPNN
jgi:hypothetical protein